MLTARNGPGSLLGSLVELLTVLFDAAQQGTSWFWQKGCITPVTDRLSRVPLGVKCE